MKNFTLLKKLQRALSVLVAIVCFSSIAVAQGSGTKDDPYILVDGGEYAYKAYKAFYAQFIVPEDVTTDNVTLELVANDMLEVFSDPEMTNCVSTVEGNFAPYTSIVPIKKGTAKGTVFYVFCSFTMHSDVVSVSYGGASVAELTKVSPEKGSILSAATSCVYFEFSKNIVFDQCVMVIGKTQKNITANLNGHFVSIEAKHDLMECYEKNLLKEGDEILFILTNVVSADGKTKLGDVTANYIAAAKPIQLVATENTPDNGLPNILSWMSTQKEQGLVKLIFSDKLNKDAEVKATLTFGQTETEDPGEYYIEEIPVGYEGDNTITIDLRGKLRLPAEMVTSGENYGSMMLAIRGVQDAAGNATLSEDSGSSGSYFFNYGFEVVNYTWIAEFTPASGSSIDNVKSIELWLQETGGNAEFSGAKFEYIYEGQTKSCIVKRDDISVSPDSEDETALLINIPVPTFSRDANTTVTLSFVNLEAPDGADYTEKLSATYTTAGYEAPAGINDCVIDELPIVVYSLDGRIVTTGKLAEVKKVLKPQTIYVVNGKKVIIKE
jgi:hypothetical protein